MDSVGWTITRYFMSNSSRKVGTVVVGAGPGGYVAAIKLSQLGIQTLLVDSRPQPGGVCLNVGCIPSKALIHSASKMRWSNATGPGSAKASFPANIESLQSWKNEVVSKLTGGVEALLKANKVEYMEGEAAFLSDSTLRVNGPHGEMEVEFDNAILATGSQPIEIPGFQIDGQNILDSTHALEMTKVPERLLVIGGGYIGLEMGTAWAKLGAQVTVVEMMPQLLPGFPKDMVSLISRKLKQSGVNVHTKTQAQSWRRDGQSLKVQVQPQGKETLELEVDRILLTVGRKPQVKGLGLEKLGLKLNEEGFISTNTGQATATPQIYAIGDLAGEPMLAHKASAEAETAALSIARKKADILPQDIPAVVFTDPEIALVGLTREKAKAQGREVKIGKFSFAANGRALTTEAAEGFVRVVGDAQDHRLLGVEMIGPEVSNLVSEAALALRLGAKLEDIANTIHPHPSLSEAFMEAAKAALGEAIHAVNR